MSERRARVKETEGMTLAKGKASECPRFLLAEDEDTEDGVELAAKVGEDEVAVRAAHAGARHTDAAARARPARILAKRDDPSPLFHLFGVVAQETGEVAGVGQGMASRCQALRGLLASFVAGERLHPQVNLPDTGPLERKALLGDVGVDVAEVLGTNGALDQLRQAEGLVVGGREADGLDEFQIAHHELAELHTELLILEDAPRVFVIASSRLD